MNEAALYAPAFQPIAAVFVMFHPDVVTPTAFANG